VKNRFILKLFIDERAQGLVEYSLIVSLLSIAVVLFVLVFQGTLLELYKLINGKMDYLINRR